MRLQADLELLAALVRRDPSFALLRELDGFFAAALVALRTGVFPAWLAWVSVVLAVGLLTPLNYIFMGFALLWVLIVSILLFRQNESVDSSCRQWRPLHRYRGYTIVPRSWLNPGRPRARKSPSSPRARRR